MWSATMDSKKDHPKYRLPNAHVIFMAKDGASEAISQQRSTIPRLRGPKHYFQKLLAGFAIDSARLPRIRSIFY